MTRAPCPSRAHYVRHCPLLSTHCFPGSHHTICTAHSTLHHLLTRHNFSPPPPCTDSPSCGCSRTCAPQEKPDHAPPPAAAAAAAAALSLMCAPAATRPGSPDADDDIKLSKSLKEQVAPGCNLHSYSGSPIFICSPPLPFPVFTSERQLASAPSSLCECSYTSSCPCKPRQMTNVLAHPACLTSLARASRPSVTGRLRDAADIM